MRLLLSIFLSQILAVAIARQGHASVEIISGVASEGQSAVQLTSAATGFDAPKVQPINGTTFDWWYFDVVSPDLDYSLVLVFFDSTSNGLWAGIPDVGSSTYASFVISMPDGSSVNGNAVGSDLVVRTLENGSSGTLNETGWSWIGLPDMSLYELIIDSPGTGVQGNVTFNSVS